MLQYNFYETLYHLQVNRKVEPFETSYGDNEHTSHLEVKQPRLEADHLPPSTVEFNAWSYTSIPQYVFLAWCLIRHRISFHGVVLS